MSPAIDTATAEKQLNEMILGGKILEAFEKFYAEDVVMQENSEAPRAGKATNREYEKQFVSALAEVHDLKLAASAVNGDTTFSEWYMDVSFKDGNRMKAAQVAVRKWKDGKIVHERFFYNRG